MTYDEKNFSEQQQNADSNAFIDGLSGMGKISDELTKEIKRQLLESEGKKLRKE